MALLQCDFFSDTLGMSSSMRVILPQSVSHQIGMSLKAARSAAPVLYLLHGLTDDHTIWCRRTSIERYAAEYGLAVIMPNVHRSFYTDMRKGYQYWTFIAEELPSIVDTFFRVSNRREDTFVAGLSMGGYGAFKLALRQPERFAAAASLSGALDLTAHFESRRDDFDLIFDSRSALEGSENDLFALTTALTQSLSPRPHLFQCCGTADFLYEDNVRFKEHARSEGLALTFEEGPGNHQWSYWDAMIQRALAWMFA